jgi:ABC-type uncharacterized transport system, permease component
MDFDKALAAGVVILYSLGTLGFFLGTLAGKRGIKNISGYVTLAGFALHTAVGINDFRSESIAELSFGFYMQFLAWCLVGIYIVAWRWLRYPFLGLTAAPLALLLYALSFRIAHSEHTLLPEHLSGLFFGMHIWSLYLSIGLLAMAFCAGLLFVYTENKLKKKSPLAGFTKDMPSLSTYDKVNFIAVVVGFPLFTLGLMSGFIWSPIAQGLTGSPKVLYSLFVWFLYALLFYQRTALGRRGRKTAVMAIAIFIISILSMGLDFTMSHHSGQLLQP